jgi:hypothetical protein
VHVQIKTTYGPALFPNFPGSHISVPGRRVPGNDLHLKQVFGELEDPSLNPVEMKVVAYFAGIQRERFLLYQVFQPVNLSRLYLLSLWINFAQPGQ